VELLVYNHGSFRRLVEEWCRDEDALKLNGVTEITGTQATKNGATHVPPPT